MSTYLNSDPFNQGFNTEQAGQTSLRTVIAQSANATVETPVFVAPNNSYVSGVQITRVTAIPSVAISGAATNLQTLTLKRYKSDGTVVGAVGGSYVTTASVAKFASVVLLTPAQTLTLKAGDVLTLVDTPSASGAATPEITIAVEYNVVPVVN